jgi:uncharacterized protein involved in exopolysaccharide biosynthesis
MNKQEELVIPEKSFKELFLEFKDIIKYLKSKSIKVFFAAFIVGLIGFAYSYSIPVRYKSTILFIVDEEKSSGLAVSGLASQLGIDLGGGSSGTIFTGSNLMELMKTKLLVQKTLLKPISYKNSSISLIDYYNLKIANTNTLRFKINQNLNEINKSDLTSLQNLTSYLISECILVQLKNKKSIFLNLSVETKDEYFSKIFCEQLASVTTEYYIETRSRKARMNYEILSKQYDSINNELNYTLIKAGSRMDNIFNLNPSQLLKRQPIERNKINLTLNTSILTQIVQNLEMAKINLRRETPLIQIIEGTDFSTEKVVPDKLGLFFLCFFLTTIISYSYYLVLKFIQ